MFHKRSVFPGMKKIAFPLSGILMLSCTLILSCMLVLLTPAQISFALEPDAATDSDADRQDPPGDLPETEASPSEAGRERLSEEPDLPEEAADKISTFAELSEWIDSHKKSGGTAQLENDIFLPAGERYISKSSWPGDPTLYIDVGEYTIDVSGHLELYPNLHFFGAGGEKGIFHVEQGGYLDLLSVTGGGVSEAYVYVSAEEGCAIYQEEGAFLGLFTNKIIGEIHCSERPVAWPFSDVAEFYGKAKYLPAVALPLKGEFEEADFPQTIDSYLCEGGWWSKQEQALPVTWNFEEFEEEFAARERFILTGEYTDDVTAMAVPSCLVTFLRKNSAVFLQCSARENEVRQQLAFEMHIKLDDPSMEHRLEWSTDGQVWQSAKAEDIDHNIAYGDEYVFQWDEAFDGTIRYDGSFNMEEQPQYFSIAVIDSHGHTTYSDTIFLNGEDKIAGWDNGGGRNGEVNPGDPENGGLPPIMLPPEEPTVPPVNPPDNTNSGNTGGGHRPDSGSPNTVGQGTEPDKNMEILMEEVSGDSDMKLMPQQTSVTSSQYANNPLVQLPERGKEKDDLVRTEDIPLTVAEGVPPVPEPDPDQAVKYVPAGQQNAREGDAGSLSFAQQPSSDTRPHSVATAVAIIALIGAPIYLAPVLKGSLKSSKFFKYFK